MRAVLASLTLSLIVVSSSCFNPMEHAHCENTEIKRVPSPNGKLVAVVYDRVCGGGSVYRRGSGFSFAKIEGPSEWRLLPGSSPPTVCYLVTLQRVHQIDVVWIDDKHLKVSIPDDLKPEVTGFQTPEATCKPIEITYDFPRAPPLK
jgi:hypothetical protein